MERRGFLKSLLVGAATALLPKTLQSAPGKTAHVPVANPDEMVHVPGVWVDHDEYSSMMTINCDGRSIEEVYEHLKYITRRPTTLLDNKPNKMGDVVNVVDMWDPNAIPEVEVLTEVRHGKTYSIGEELPSSGVIYQNGTIQGHNVQEYHLTNYWEIDEETLGFMRGGTTYVRKLGKNYSRMRFLNG